MYVGKSFMVNIAVTDGDSERYAEVSGDHNPLLVDKNFSKKSQFGKQISQGNSIIGWLTGIIATSFSGPGALPTCQKMRIKSPVFVISYTESHLTCYKCVERAGVLYKLGQCVSGDILCMNGLFKVYETGIESNND